MGNTTSYKPSAKSAGYKPRKATFTVSGKGAERVFTPVNRRAHIVAKKAGKRTKVTLSDLKKLSKSGSYKYYAYTPKGALVAVRV